MYLNEAAFEGNPERRASHIAPRGWYSEAVLATVLRIKQNLFKLDLDNPVRPTDESARRLFNPHVAGIVINHPLAHWVAIREESDAIWLLDNLYTPRQLTFNEYQAYLTRYPSSFAVMIQLLVEILCKRPQEALMYKPKRPMPNNHRKVAISTPQLIINTTQ